MESESILASGSSNMLVFTEPVATGKVSGTETGININRVGYSPPPSQMWSSELSIPQNPSTLENALVTETAPALVTGKTHYNDATVSGGKHNGFNSSASITAASSSLPKNQFVEITGVSPNNPKTGDLGEAQVGFLGAATAQKHEGQLGPGEVQSQNSDSTCICTPKVALTPKRHPSQDTVLMHGAISRGLPLATKAKMGRRWRNFLSNSQKRKLSTRKSALDGESLAKQNLAFPAPVPFWDLAANNDVRICKDKLVEDWLDVTIGPLLKNKNLSAEGISDGRLDPYLNWQTLKKDCGDSDGISYTGPRGANQTNTQVKNHASVVLSDQDSVEIMENDTKLDLLQKLIFKAKLKSLTRKLGQWSQKVRSAAKRGKPVEEVEHGHSYDKHWKQDYCPELYYAAAANSEDGSIFSRPENFLVCGSRRIPSSSSLCFSDGVPGVCGSDIITEENESIDTSNEFADIRVILPSGELGLPSKVGVFRSPKLHKTATTVVKPLQEKTFSARAVYEAAKKIKRTKSLIPAVVKVSASPKEEVKEEVIEEVFTNRLATDSFTNSKSAERKLFEIFKQYRDGSFEEKDSSFAAAENFTQQINEIFRATCDGSIPLTDNSEEDSGDEWKNTQPPIDAEGKEDFFKPVDIQDISPQSSFLSNPTRKEIPFQENKSSEEIPAEEIRHSTDILAEDIITSEEIPAEEITPSDEIKPSDEITTGEIKVLEDFPDQNIPVENFKHLEENDTEETMAFGNCEEEFVNPFFGEVVTKCSQGFMKELKLVQKFFVKTDKTSDDSCSSGAVDQASISKLETGPPPVENATPAMDTVHEASDCGSPDERLVAVALGPLPSETIEDEPSASFVDSQNVKIESDLEVEESVYPTVLETVHQCSTADPPQKKNVRVNQWWKFPLWSKAGKTVASENLWQALSLNQDSVSERIKKDFAEGNDLHITWEAKKKISFLTNLKNVISEKANSVDQDFERDPEYEIRVSFSQEMDAIIPDEIDDNLKLNNTSSIPSNGILSSKRNPRSPNFFSKTLFTEEFKQPLDSRRRRAIEAELWEWIDGCKTITLQLKEKLDSKLFEKVCWDLKTSCRLSFDYYIKEAECQILNYTYYLSQVSNAITISLGALTGTGHSFAILVDFLASESLTKASLDEVESRTKLIIDSLENSGALLSRVEMALLKLTEDPGYVEAMIDIAQTGVKSKKAITKVYGKLLKDNVKHEDGRRLAHKITECPIYFRESKEFSNNEEIYETSTFFGFWGDLREALDIVAGVQLDFEDRTKSIMMNVTNLQSELTDHESKTFSPRTPEEENLELKVSAEFGCPDGPKETGFSDEAKELQEIKPLVFSREVEKETPIQAIISDPIPNFEENGPKDSAKKFEIPSWMKFQQFGKRQTPA